MYVLQSQSFQYPSLPEVRGKGQNNDEHDDWSSSNQRWSRCDTGQKEEPSDKTTDKDTPAAKAETQSAVTITKDEITAVIVAKIKKKRDNNEKIGQLLKTYGVAQLSDLPAEKYEAFLADVSQI